MDTYVQHNKEFEGGMQGGSIFGWAAALLCATPAFAWAAPTTNYAINPVALKSQSVLVVDADSGEVIAAKNADAVVPVASLTKLMTALIVLEAGQNMVEELEITS